MIFGKQINRYYLKYSWMLFLGLAALIAAMTVTGNLE